MNAFLRFFALAGTVGMAAALRAAAPLVTNTHVSQDESTLAVTVSYALNAPAIVTVRFFTNALDGIEGALAIPEAVVTNLTGEVNRVVGTAGEHTLVWRPREADFPKSRNQTPDFRAKVCAWSLKAPPPIMVCDLVTPSNTAYYASVDALPGGLLANDDYRTTKLVLKKVEASWETWTRGSTAESGRGSAEQAHAVTLTNDYYLGIFEFTQAQYTNVNPSAHAFAWKGGKRPADGISYRYLRDDYASDASHPERCYPTEPFPTTFLGMLRTRTGQAFDIPSESQWEFAARGGYGEGVWGDGTKITATVTCPNLTLQARYKANGYTDNGDGTVTTNGTAEVGSYAPNAYGFYDMSGNVNEWCLDWGQGSDYYNDLSVSNGKDVSSLAGAVNAIGNRIPVGVVTKKAGSDQRSHSYELGDLLIGQDRSYRGGCWSDSASSCRPRYRNWTHYSYDMGSSSYKTVGFRVALTLNASVLAK